MIACFTGAGAPALIGALVFGLQPVHSDVVASIVGRGELLPFVSGAAALLCYLQAAQASGRARWLRLIATAVLLFVALGAKESAVTWIVFVPLVGFVHDLRSGGDWRAAMRAQVSRAGFVLGPALLWGWLYVRFLSGLAEDFQVPYEFNPITVPIREMDDEALARLALEGQLYLSLVEMQTIKARFESLDRDPTDIELETIAQTWSEHCSHKTLAGRIRYEDSSGERKYENMLKETIFAATVEIRERLGKDDWCVSVFKDNAGIVTFDDDQCVCFKVETHNHPSALEPYGGANTGIGAGLA